jgi:twinkle protein
MTLPVKSISDFWEKAKDRYFKRNIQSVGFPLVWEKMPFKIRLQELSIWSGYAGHGKSAVLSMIALQMATLGQKTVIASFEMPADQTASRMLKQALGTSTATEKEIDQCKEWMSEYIYIYDYVGRVKSQQGMIAHFEEAYDMFGITQFQVDSLLKCGMNEDDYNGQKRLVEELHNFSMANPSHVHLVAHSRKGDDEYKIPGKMDVAHSGSIGQLCNNGFTVWRNKKKEEYKADSRALGSNDITYDALISCWKSRECGPEEEGRFGFYYNHSAIQYLEKEYGAPLIFSKGDICEPPF